MLAKEDLPVAELHGAGRSNVKHGAVQAQVLYPWLSGSRPAPGHIARIMDEVANTDGCIMLLGVKARVTPGMGNMKKQARMLQDVSFKGARSLKSLSSRCKNSMQYCYVTPNPSKASDLSLEIKKKKEEKRKNILIWKTPQPSN